LVIHHLPQIVAEIAELEEEMETLGIEMLEAGSDEEEEPRSARNLALQRLIAGMDQRRALVRQRWRPNIDREVEEMHSEINREVEERRRRDREDEEDCNNELRNIEHEDAQVFHGSSYGQRAEEADSQAERPEEPPSPQEEVWQIPQGENAVESEFDGIADEVIAHFLNSEPTWPATTESDLLPWLFPQ